MTDTIPDYFDDDAPLPEAPPDGAGEYTPILAELEGEFAKNGYLAQSIRHHPQIEWPVKTAPKKKGDISFAPSQKHKENTARLCDAYGIVLRWNLMRHSLEITIPEFTPAPERAENATLAEFFGIVLRRGLSKENSLDHVLTLAREYHPVRDWIHSRPWDGTDRLPDLMATLTLQAGSDTALAGMLITRWLVSCVAAVMPSKPGARPFTPQGVLTLQGAQGKGKTEWFKSLAPADSGWIQAGEMLDPHDRDSVQQATSHWIVELGEIDATFKKADIAALKAFITKAFDVYRSAYARREERTPRRTVLAGTVNPKSYLVDATGNRRWWTVPISSIVWQHDIDMQQLWAQVNVMYDRGDAWWLTEPELAALNRENAQHEMRDPIVDELWESWKAATVHDALTPPRITLSEIWRALPGREGRQRSRGESSILLGALRDAGLENAGLLDGYPTFRVEKIARQVWQPKQESWRHDSDR